MEDHVIGLQSWACPGFLLSDFAVTLIQGVQAVSLPLALHLAVWLALAKRTRCATRNLGLKRCCRFPYVALGLSHLHEKNILLNEFAAFRQRLRDKPCQAGSATSGSPAHSWVEEVFVTVSSWEVVGFFFLLHSIIMAIVKGYTRVVIDNVTVRTQCK